MKAQRKVFKVYRDEVKERSTTHWDFDYMSTAEFNAAMSGGRSSGRSKPSSVPGAIRGLARRVKRFFLSNQAKPRV